MTSRRERFKVRWGEVDPAGIVYFPVFFTWFNEGMHGLMASCGWPPNRVHDAGRGLPAREAQARFHRPLRVGDEIEVETTVVEVRTRAVRFQYRLFCGEELMAEGTDVRVWVRKGDGRIAASPFPPDLHAALSQLVVSREGAEASGT